MSQEVIELRRATLDDLQEILRITAEVVRLLNADGNFQWDNQYPLQSHFEKDIANNELWVATVDGAVAGFAALTTDQPEEYAQVGWDVSEPAIVPHRVATDPVHRRKSIAARFIQKAEELAREAGYKRVRIDTSKLNIPMQKVFAKMEYKYAGDMNVDWPGPAGDIPVVCYEKNV